MKVYVTTFMRGCIENYAMITTLHEPNALEIGELSNRWDKSTPTRVRIVARDIDTNMSAVMRTADRTDRPVDFGLTLSTGFVINGVYREDLYNGE